MPVCAISRQQTQFSVLSSREGYNNPQVSAENLIGLSRARRPNNAIFVNFDDEVPTKPLDAAAQAWKKVCTNPVDRKVEEELRKVRAMFLSWAGHSALLCCVGKDHMQPFSLTSQKMVAVLTTCCLLCDCEVLCISLLGWCGLLNYTRTPNPGHWNFTLPFYFTIYVLSD